MAAKDDDTSTPEMESCIDVAYPHWGRVLVYGTLEVSLFLLLKPSMENQRGDDGDTDREVEKYFCFLVHQCHRLSFLLPLVDAANHVDVAVLEVKETSFSAFHHDPLVTSHDHFSILNLKIGQCGMDQKVS